jgi:hypothetical protein
LEALIENAERGAIFQALKAIGHNRNMAAVLLKIHCTGLYLKMKKYHIPGSFFLKYLMPKAVSLKHNPDPLQDLLVFTVKMRREAYLVKRQFI